MGPRLKDVEDEIPRGREGYPWQASMGPRLKDVEDANDDKQPHRERNASMGPRLKDVEDRMATTVSDWLWDGFNGATSQGRGRLG